MLKLLRVIFLVLLVIFTALLIVRDSLTSEGQFSLARWWLPAIVGVLLYFAGIIALDILTPKRKLSTITAIFVGLIAGVVVTLILGTIVDLFGEVYRFAEAQTLEPFKVMLGIGICYLSISTVLQTQDDFRLVIPYVEFAKKIRGARPLALDTSALIDGRILELSAVGLFQASLIIPRFVIEELQRLSDSSDRMKRARGRRGLEMVGKLQRSGHADVRIEEAIVAPGTVDTMLIEFARNLPATIVTTDSGLARVAGIQSVSVINLNEASAALRPSILPGETLSLLILRRGEQPGQGVGYVEDGTMVVVEDGEPYIGQTVMLIVTSAMQTSAGRLIFGRISPIADPSETLRPRTSDSSMSRMAERTDRERPAAQRESAPDASAMRPRESEGDAASPEHVAEPMDDQAGAGPGRTRGPYGPSRGDGSQRSSRNPRRT